jgi:hypothetical protein
VTASCKAQTDVVVGDFQLPYYSSGRFCLKASIDEYMDKNEVKFENAGSCVQIMGMPVGFVRNASSIPVARRAAAKSG